MSSDRSEDAHEELLLERLRILLDRLRWSYVALWTLNPRTRMLEWKRGHFEIANAKAETREYAQLFYTAYKSCYITPGVGAVGRANLEGKHIWLTGDTVCQHAGSLEQSQFLRCADIKTTMCIPWVDSVLEIGIVNVVAEDFGLTDRIQQVLANDLLSVRPEPDLGHASQTGLVAGIAMFQGFHQDSAPADHPTNLALQPPSNILRPSPITIGSLAEQVWRSANSLSLRLSSDMFMQEPELQSTDSHIGMVKENSSFRLQTGASSMQTPARRPPEIDIQAVNQSRGLMTGQADQYIRSIWSGAEASSSVSSHDDSSARTSVSPELQQQIHANSSAPPRFSAHDGTSTSTGTLVLRSQLQADQYGSRQCLKQIRGAHSCGDQYEIQRDLTLLEAQEMPEQWRQQLHPPVMATEPTHLPAGQHLPLQGSWQRSVGSSILQINTNEVSFERETVIKRTSNVTLMNQVSKLAGPLLRRQSLPALALLKDVDMYQKEAAADVSNLPYDIKPVAFCEDPMPAHVQINTPNTRGQRRTVGVGNAISRGPVHAGHDGVAVSHMLAERRRRTKQKENFAALRRLVPIISKADKASTLIDTITYLKFLQNKMQEMEASKEEIDQRCEILEKRCQELKERNQEIAATISKPD